MTQYGHGTGKGGLFVDYINTFFKLKTEASGYPGLFHGRENVERYAEDFWTSEEIRLEKEAIRYNAEEWGVAKHCLNYM